MSAPRGRIADQSPDGTPYGHLQPVVDAELEWGNQTRDGWEYDRHDTWFTARFRYPLHLERLQAEFDFPEHVKVGRTRDGQTYVSDHEHLVSVSGFPPPGPRPRKPRPARTGLLARLLGE